MTFEIFNPDALGEPKGWNNGLLAPDGGRILFVAGQTARDAEGHIGTIEFVGQFRVALDNVLRVVREAGGSPTDIGRMTVFVTNLMEYRASLRELGEAYREHMGRHYPAMTLVEVSGLVDLGAKVEIEATAVIPVDVPASSD